MSAPWSDVINLVSLVEGIDEDGFPAVVEGEPRLIFANKLSVRSQEFHMAKQSGVDLSYMFEIRSIEYEGEEQIEYKGKDHTVYRTYEKGEFIELICKRKADDHGT